MSLSDLAEPASSSSSSSSSPSSFASSSALTQPSTSQTRINLTIPTSLLILPPTAALIGLSIGLVRGGSRARLRFLAENAHRQPKTIQGWYFYTKTRNYRVFFGAAKTGSKYFLGLGGATAVYVLLDESIGSIRESIFGPRGVIDPTPGGRALLESKSINEAEGGEGENRRVGWRKGGVMWEDGSLAGGLMGLGVGTIYRLPRQLFIRSIMMGTILGGLTSAMQIAQAHIGKLREEEEAKSTPEIDKQSIQPIITEEVIPPSSDTAKEDKEVIERSREFPAVDQIPIGDEEGKSWWSSFRSLIGK
ncbi:uncharacterized protein IL334_003137 [Kwoniella shivajii]|uniref:Mitochondrial protein n=1 Tax=Kwoniella shivajii TaxID=564305 RepID=A0ABZ1CYG5_9TREE|nr:hypothetical protein IL334_003137 [Kwoniella shivajii]